MKIFNLVVIFLLIACSIILGANELTGSEELYFDTLNIWLIGLALAFAGGGAWGLIRTFSTSSGLTHIIFKLIQRDYSDNPHPMTPFILKPLVSAVEQLRTTLQSRDNEYEKHVVTLQSKLDSALSEKSKEMLTLIDDNKKLGAISHELGQAHARLNRDLGQLEEIQRSLLPALYVEDKELSIRSYYQPNGKTGGDYYDFILASDDEVFLAIADVSGHGSPAAFIMGITRALLHSKIVHHQSPAEILQSLNEYLIRSIRSNEFVTMFLGRLDRKTKKFTFSNAGHLPPVWLRPSDEEICELEESRGVPLGVLDEPNYDETQIQMGPGEKIVLYTDGVVELFNKERMTYSEERLHSLLKENRNNDSVDLLDVIIQDLQMFLERDLDVLPVEDDLTVVVFTLDDC
ncbi:MAG: PP2C family protein-serine/threonine phosphatase [Candidatus Hinthialibacter antarcticus]|nr:PP2C family protein-serine/threonine phosphatase [Candidatus Hinthialibacter antarcticus]